MKTGRFLSNVFLIIDHKRLVNLATKEIEDEETGNIFITG